MNTYVGTVEDDLLTELGSRALEKEIRAALELLNDKGECPQVVDILLEMIGERDGG